jgi:hypothetical protein
MHQLQPLPSAFQGVVPIISSTPVAIFDGFVSFFFFGVSNKSFFFLDLIHSSCYFLWLYFLFCLFRVLGLEKKHVHNVLKMVIKIKK